MKNGKKLLNLRLFDEGGQIALVVLLIMIVMLTLGLSVAKRGLFDVTLSQQEEESSRAFQAAETGVEEAMRTLTGGSGILTGDTSYNVTVSEGGTNGFVVDQAINPGESLAVEMSGASDVASLDVYFGDKNVEDCTGNPPAIEIAVVKKSGVNTTVSRSAFDLLSRSNGFTVIAAGSHEFEGKTFCGLANVSSLGQAVEIRLRPLYSKATIGIDPRPDAAILPAQYNVIRSEGKTGTNVTRAVEVQRLNSQLPTIFDYVVFSGNAISL